MKLLGESKACSKIDYLQERWTLLLKQIANACVKNHYLYNNKVTDDWHMKQQYEVMHMIFSQHK